MTITYQQIFTAYKKLKNYYYYDNTSLYARKTIADFESSFYVDNSEDEEFNTQLKTKFKSLLMIVNGDDGGGSLLNSLIDGIEYRLLPKPSSSGQDTADTHITYISNVSKNEQIAVDQVNAVIVAPLEIHLISVLWLMIVGVKYVNDVDRHNYAYQMELTADTDEGQSLNRGYHLFKPYFRGYQEWRDNAMTKASALLKQGENATIVSLDLKRFFYSVRVNVETLLKSCSTDISSQTRLDEEALRLTRILQQIHQAYHRKIQDISCETALAEGNEALLPVGLLSSGFLANLYLSEFDRRVEEYLKPSFYGRYVDDMLFVISGENVDNPRDFIKRIFVQNTKLLSFEDTGATPYLRILNDDEHAQYSNSNLIIQENKVVIEHFDHTESRAALKKFISNLNKQRSEFRFLPDEDWIESDFDDSAFNLQYVDSVNKFRSIKDFKEDKYGASSYLAHKIFLSCYTTGEKKSGDDASNTQILQFFRGATAIFFYSLWEKVATYFILNDNKDGLSIFEKNILKAINSIEKAGDSTYSLEILKKSLSECLTLSIAVPLALKSSSKRYKKYQDSAFDIARKFRNSNLFRHNLLTFGAISVTDVLLDDEVDLTHIDLSTCNLSHKDSRIIYFFPRFLHYDEITILEMYKGLLDNTGTDFNENRAEIDEEINDLYKTINYGWHTMFTTSPIDKKVTFVENRMEGQKFYFTVRDTHETNTKDGTSKNVAIANMKVDSHLVGKLSEGSQDLSIGRRRELFSIINTAVEHHCDLLVLPELSVPNQWIDLLAFECKKHNLAIVAGLTYIYNPQRYAFNVVATLLPVNVNGFSSCAVRLRVKNHYAPAEINELQGYRFKIPTYKTAVYDMFHWRNLYFTVYNCFELACIEDRALFKSEVDLIIATELNKDTSYFSEIVGSWVRDLHCYFIQVNTSEYGDSRIMKPSSRDERNMVVVSGGKNAVALVEDINLNALRRFEFKEYNLQEKDRSFKKTPPNFNRENVLRRIKDLEMGI